MPHHLGQQIGLEYAILWFTTIINIILYIPLSLHLRGNLYLRRVTGEGRCKTHMKLEWRTVETRKAWVTKDGRREAPTIARQILAYPIVYSKGFLTFRFLND